jgi:hypothetical protein
MWQVWWMSTAPLGAAGRTAASRGSPSARAHSAWPADNSQTMRRGARVHLDDVWVTMADAWPTLWRRTDGGSGPRCRCRGRQRRSAERACARALLQSAKARGQSHMWPTLSPKIWSEVKNLQIWKLQIEIPATTFTQVYMMFEQWFVWERRSKLAESSVRFTVQNRVDQDFGHLPLRIWNATLNMKCVPGNNEELLYWSILNFYREIWRTRKKIESAFWSSRVWPGFGSLTKGLSAKVVKIMSNTLRS